MRNYLDKTKLSAFQYCLYFDYTFGYNNLAKGKVYNDIYLDSSDHFTSPIKTMIDVCNPDHRLENYSITLWAFYKRDIIH